MTAVPTETPERFSATVRRETTGDHRAAERSSFMSALFGGQLPLEGYVDMLAQHWYAYERLEANGARMVDDPAAGPFVDAALLRLPALTADLTELAGAGWASTYGPSEATEEYVEAIDRASSWSGGFVAHHYTRYLGDLSGGQHIGALAARTYDLAPGRGGNFATFDGIVDPAEYRESYRVRLDGAPWDEAERERFITEVQEAYRLNQAVFADLDRHVA